MSFDTKNFYDQLDGHYAAHDNEATERFLLDCLNNVENSVYLAPGCSCCGDGGSCSTDNDELSEGEREWLVTRSQGMIAILNELACFYRGVSRWPECIDSFTRLKKEMEDCQLTATDNYALVTLNLAGAYRLMGKLDEALSAFDEAGRILEANGKNDPYSISSLYNNKGLVYQDMRDFAKASEHFEKALEYMRLVPDNDAEIATALTNAATAFYSAGDREKAARLLDESIEMFEKLDGGMNPHYAGALNTKAIFAFNAGDYETAAKTFEQAIEKTKLIFGENREFVIGCRNCSYAYSRLGNEEMSRKYGDMAAAAEARLPNA